MAGHGERGADFPVQSGALSSNASASHRRRLPQFLLVGGLGFVVDAAILLALTNMFAWQAVPARIASFLGAVSVTWLMNRYSTFADRRALHPRASAGEYARYLLTQSMGAAINLLVFWLALWFMPVLHEHLLLPLALGSACGLVFNYSVMHHLVFPRRTENL